MLNRFKTILLKIRKDSYISMSVTTPDSANTKKRELSCPEFIVDIKKNRVRSGSDSETDISDLSISEKSVMDRIN